MSKEQESLENEEDLDVNNKKQDGDDSDSKPKTVPYERLQAATSERNALQKRIDEFEAAEQKRLDDEKIAEEKRLAEQSEFEALADKYKSELGTATESNEALSGKVEKYEAVLTALYEARKTAVPELYQPLLDSMPLADRLRWIADNEEKLTSESKPSDGIPITPSQNGNGKISDADRRRRSVSAW